MNFLPRGVFDWGFHQSRPHPALVWSSILALIVACATVAREPAPAPVRTEPFSVSSFRSSRGIRTALEGVVVIYPDWIYVVVRQGAIRTDQRDPQQYWDVRLRVALGTCDDEGHWSVLSESPAVRVAPVLSIKQNANQLDTLTRRFQDTLRLNLGVPRGTELRRSLLSFTLEWPLENRLAMYSLITDVALAEPLDPQEAARVRHCAEKAM